jgi:hypothetical protein
MSFARANPGDVERLLLNTATQDGNRSASGLAKIPDDVVL